MLHVRIQKSRGQEIIKNLRGLDLIDKEYKIINDSRYVYVPVKGTPEGYETIDLEGVHSTHNEPEKVSFSYDIIGSIAIIKGKTLEEAKYLSDFLKSRKNIKTIYLDHGISGEFRTRQLTLIYGEPVYRTIYQENGIRLYVDVSRAYFSPRLASERLRIAKEVSDGENIIDMFAGIGPFSLLIAKNKKCSIVAMDKNKDAIDLLNENVGINKLKGTILPIAGDSGRLIKSYSNINRVIMNLPHDAWQFIEAAYNSLANGGLINYYEICDLKTLESRMESFREIGLELVYKRIVHGFSKFQNMYSMEVKKI
jgi:tRNA (guanine37-N1)-methyltransferase